MHFYKLWRTLSLLFLVSTAAYAQPVQVTPPEKEAEDKAFTELMQRIEKVGPDNHLKVSELYREFLKAHPALSSEMGNLVTTILGQLYLVELKNPQSALEVFEYAAQKYPTAPEYIYILTEKSRALQDLKRYDEARQVMQEFWQHLTEATPEHAQMIGANISSPLGLYFTDLEAQGKTDELLATLRKILTLAPAFVDDRGDWMYALIIDTLLAREQTAEALQWARQRYGLCGYESNRISRAAGSLARAISAGDASQRMSLAFVAAQQEPTKINPLAATTLPPVDKQALQEQIQRLERDPDQVHSLISLYMLAGSWRKAMQTACRLTVKAPQSEQGTQEICRIFKAADLHLARANAVANFPKTGAGAEVLQGFFKEHPAMDQETVTEAPEAQIARLMTRGLAVPRAISIPAVTIPFIAVQLRVHATTPEAIIDSKSLTADDLLSAFETSWFYQWDRIALAGLLVQFGDERLKPPTVLNLNVKVKLALAEYYHSIRDPQTVPLMEDLLDKRGVDRTLLLRFLATYYEATGDYRKAAETFLRSPQYVTSTESLDIHNEYAARLYRKAGDAGKARELSAKVPPRLSVWATGMDVLDQVRDHIKQGQHAEARMLLQQPLTGHATDRLQVLMLSQLAYSYYLTGEFEVARKTSKAAIAQHKTIKYPAPGQGLEEAVTIAHNISLWVNRWANDPLICQAASLTVSAPQTETVKKHMTLFLHHPVPLVITSNNPHIKAYVQNTAANEKKDYFVEQKLVVEIAPPAFAKLMDTSVIISSTQLPNLKVQIPIHLEEKGNRSSLAAPIVVAGGE